MKKPLSTRKAVTALAAVTATIALTAAPASAQSLNALRRRHVRGQLATKRKGERAQ